MVPSVLIAEVGVVTRSLWKWTRLASPKWEDAWEERLRFLGERLVIYQGNRARMLRFEAYLDDERSAAALRERFGGTVKEIPAAQRLAPQKRRDPLRIRGVLTVIDSDEPSPPRTPGSAIPLHVPAGMAFGTGEHATTATCLRILCDLAPKLPVGWRLLDLGTGSGILAIAGRALGAAKVEAFDNDPVCVRIAKENVKRNGANRIVVRRGDVLRWEPVAPFEVVTSNLYSEVLIQAAPAIAAAVAPGGILIFSGVLRTQYAECANAFRAEGLDVEAPRVRGKWTAGVARRVGSKFD